MTRSTRSVGEAPTENGDKGNEAGFEWIGSGIKVSRLMYFGRCNIGGVEISVGDNVEIKLGEDSCAVAELLELYESVGENPHRAKIRWYYPYDDLPKRCQAHVSLDDLNKKELYRPEDDLFLGSVEEIDAETIFNSVDVRDIGVNDIIPSNVYFARYYFSNLKTKNPLTPIFGELELENMEEDEEDDDDESDEEVQINYTKIKAKTKKNGTEVLSGSPSKCNESDNKEEVVMSGKMKKNAERWKSYSTDEVISELWKTNEKDNRTGKKATKRKLNSTPNNRKSIDPNNDPEKKENISVDNDNEKYCGVVISPIDSKIRRTSDVDASSDVAKQIDFILPGDVTPPDVDLENKTEFINKKVSPFKAALPKKEINAVKVFEFDDDDIDKGVLPDNINRSAKKVSKKLVATSDEESSQDKITDDDFTDEDDARYTLNSNVKKKKRKSIVTPKRVDTKKKTKEITKTPVSNGKTKSPSKTAKSVSNSVKQHGMGELTPSISHRKTPRLEAKSMLEMARKRLHVSAVPDTLPCRDAQFSQIFAFVQDRLKEGTGGCMYISGVPGTGKTATVHEVVRTLQENIEDGVIPDFKFVEINGMKLTDPNQIYPQILKALEGKKATPDHAADLLSQRFRSRHPKKENVVLMVDELDLLCNKKQNVMYNIFDWPTYVKSQLVVLAIANTMDLPERVMMNRVSSRLGTNRMTFQPYTYKELQEIVLSRINKWIEAFEEDALQLVARKVAAVSGDARRCLDICRRAVEICENLNAASKKQTKSLVGMKHVELALEEMFSSPKIKALQSLSDMETMFMKAVITEFRRTGLEEALFMEIYDQFKSHCALEDGIEPPNMSETFAICNNLGSCRLLLIETGNKDLHQRVRLNVNMDDVMFAFKSKNS